jgi:ATP-dependent Lon protease
MDSIKNIFKRYAREGKEFIHNLDGKQEPNDQIYEDFHELVESIYDGEFFERVPLEDRKKFIKEQLTPEQIKELKEQLEHIHDTYRNSSPSVIDILKMNISLEQKQKLLERVHCLVNSEVLTPEYNSNMKFLHANISNNDDPELLALEERILKSSLNKTDSYRMKILKSSMSFENKVIAYKKLEIMETYEDTDTSEYAKYKSWMDSLLSIPFGIYNDSGITTSSELNDIKTYIKNVRNILDEKLSFLEKPKDQIINLVTQMVRNPDVNINAIGLCGSAGVGKTQICQSVAEALGRPFKMISLGGESDVSSLIGHNFTYVGSGSGSIINTLIDSKSMNPILLFDELDKVGETNHGKEIIGTLIHLTDSTTNNKYNSDKYFSGIEFDLSKVLFVFTYNDATKIDRILADRLIKINVDNYNFKEKLEITNKHIVPYLLDKFKFNQNDITFNQDALEYIVRDSKKETGMRDIKTKIKIIISRINNLLLTNETDNIIKLKYKKLYPYYHSLPVIVPKEHIDILFEESISDSDKNDRPPDHMYI